MEAVDNYIPTPVARTDKPFLMPIEDVFGDQGPRDGDDGTDRAGMVKVGETVEIIGLRDTQTTTVTGVEMFKKLLDKGAPGTTWGRCCAGLSGRMLSAGWCWRNRARSSRTRNLMREVYVFKKEEGGRHTPFFNGYRPQFYSDDGRDWSLLPEGVEMVMPGTISRCMSN